MSIFFGFCRLDLALNFQAPFPFSGFVTAGELVDEAAIVASDIPALGRVSSIVCFDIECDGRIWP